MFEKHPLLSCGLRQSAADCQRAYFRGDNDAARAQLEPGSVMVWSCVAESHVDAQRERHRHLGFEPYRPPEDRDEA